MVQTGDVLVVGERRHRPERIREEIRHRRGRVQEGVGGDNIYTLGVGRIDRDAEVPVAAEDAKNFLVVQAEDRVDRVVGALLRALGKGGRPARAHVVVKTALLAHAQGRAGLQLAAEAVGAAFRGLSGNNLDLLVHGAGKRVQCGGATVAADAGGRHPVDVEAGETRRHAADADIVDHVVLIGGERDAGQSHRKFRDTERRQVAPFVEGGDILDVGRVTLLGDRKRRTFTLRGDGERIHHQRRGGLHRGLESRRLASADRNGAFFLVEARIADRKFDRTGRKILEQEAAGIVGKLSAIQRRDRDCGALQAVSSFGADHGTGDRTRGGRLPVGQI